MANEQMRDYWAARGADWVANQAIFERILAPFSDAALRALAPQPGERILDVGCGFGATLAALAASGAEVTGVDISEPMVLEARRRVPEASVLQADAQVDDLLTGAPYDGVFSRFGVMFFDDPVAAFENIAAATRPGGRLAFACWRSPAENPHFTTGVPLLVAAMPDPPVPPDPLAPGPFAFADAERVRAILGGAGWQEVAVEPFDAQMVFATDGGDGVDEAMAALAVHPVGRMFTAQVDSPRREEVLHDVRLAYEAARVDGKLSLPGAIWIATAYRP